MTQKSKWKDKLNDWINLLFPVILFFYPLRHVRVGAEWWDTGYNYANFTYMDQMDQMWLFSTYLGNVVGNFFTKLPFGGTMLGLQVYTGLVVSFLALMSYFFFVKEVRIPKGITFVGVFIALSLCWCPTAVLYNYLTYVFWSVGILFLYHALMYEKKSAWYFVLAGISLGVSVFVRFSNLSNMALIVAVWAMGIIRKEKVKKVGCQTLWCILGYLMGLGIMFGWISIRYGAGNYVQSIMRLLSMPQEASSYTLYSMIHYQIINYQQNLIWLSYLGLFVLVGMLVYQVLPKSLNLLKNIGYVVGAFGWFYVLMVRMNMFNLKYSTKMSVFQWAVMLLTATLIVGAVVIFGKRFTHKEKLLCGLGMIVMVITPLGSNNHLYLSINNLFFVAPVTFWFLYRFLRYLPKQWKLKKYSLYTYPVKAMCLCILSMVLIQGTLFGWGYIFSETNGGENLHTPIENNAVLAGMKTDSERAKLISEISSYVSANDLKGKEVILYGNIPAMSFYLEMPFAISAWPDLASYNYSIMLEDLMEVENMAECGEKALPIILMDKPEGTFVTEGMEGVEALTTVTDTVITKIEADQKLILLKDMMQRNNYQVTFENEKFVLFLAQTEGE